MHSKHRGLGESPSFLFSTPHPPDHCSLSSNRLVVYHSCYINLTSTVVGAGILGLPHAVTSTGFLGGTLLLILCALSSSLALHFLSRCVKKCSSYSQQPASFYSIAEAAVPGYSAFIDFAVAIKCFGVATSYLIVVGDLMPAAVDQMQRINGTSAGPFADRTTWITIAFVVVTPLSFFRALDSLKFTSLLSFGFILMLVLVIVLFAVPSVSSLDPCISYEMSDTTCPGSREWLVLNTSSVRALSIFVFAYTCQQNLFTLVNELENPSQTRVDSVIGASIGTACIVFLIAGICGYWTYGDMVASDLLKSYPELSVTTFARICVSTIVMFHYPLQANPARRSILTLLQSLDGGQEPTINLYNARYVITTTMFLLISFFIAITVEDLGVILALVGASGSTIVSYILPGLFYYRIFQRNDDEINENVEEPRWKLHVALAQLIVGIVLIPTSMTMILVDHFMK